MTDDRLRIRPSLTTAPTPEGVPEHFQNQTLRPVLKMQNELLLELVRHFLIKRKVKLAHLNEVERRQQISHSIAKDNRLRSLLFGCVLGQFTTEELAYYLTHEGEVNRRLSTLLTERVVSQVDRLLK